MSFCSNVARLATLGHESYFNTAFTTYALHTNNFSPVHSYSAEFSAFQMRALMNFLG